MKEEQFKDMLRERRVKLQKQIRLLEEQLRACDTMLANPGRSAGAANRSRAAGSADVRIRSAAVARDTCCPQGIFEPTAEELAEIADSTRRGRKMAKVELAIAQCGARDPAGAVPFANPCDLFAARQDERK